MAGILKRAFKRATSFAINWNNFDGADVAGGGIDAIDQSKKRRMPGGAVRSLDDEIPDRKRQRVSLSARNVTRNFELAAWAIRKHLDFVSTFTFAMRSKSKSFNADVEGFVEFWGRPQNFDTTGRHGLRKSIRLAESSRCVDGDVFFVKLDDGKTQAIEADRCKTPDGGRSKGGDFNAERTFNGVEVAINGRPLRFAIHSRSRPSGLVFQRWIRANRIFHHGFFDRFDQHRGVSPIVAALNRFQDVYENFDYALARSKVAQLFSLVFFRDAAENQMGPVTGEDADGDGKDDRFNVKLGTRPMIFDLDPGEDAKFLENKTPAAEFQTFTNAMIGVALKSLDIPFSFFDESFTNFFGSKAALTLYLHSARDKRADVQELLRKLTLWRLRLAIEDGDITLPRSIETLDDLKFEWIPAGIPWFDPRDIRGDIDAVKAGLKTREQIRRDKFGDSWAEDVVPVLIAEQKLIEDNGLNITMDTPPAPVQVVGVDEIEENAGTK